MKQWLMVGCLVLSGCAERVVALRGDYNVERIRRVALIGFEDYPGVPNSGDMIADVFEKSLLEADYQLIERRNVHDVLREQRISISGAIDPKTARALGKILGVDGLLFGSISGFKSQEQYDVMVQVREQHQEPVLYTTYEQQKHGDTWVTVPRTNYGGMRTEYKDYTRPESRYDPASVGLTVRMVDAETGEVVWVGSTSSYGSTIDSAADETCRRIMKRVEALKQKRNKNLSVKWPNDRFTESKRQIDQEFQTVFNR